MRNARALACASRPTVCRRCWPSSTAGSAGAYVADQATSKAEARRVFNRTFAITAALNAFTLGVAGIALFTSLLTLGQARLPQLAPLWAIGLTRRQIAALELVKTMALALLTALLALPLGIVVAWCLIEVVNVKAFGWRLPLQHFPGQLAAAAAGRNAGGVACDTAAGDQARAHEADHAAEDFCR